MPKRWEKEETMKRKHYDKTQETEQEIGQSCELNEEGKKEKKPLTKKQIVKLVLAIVSGVLVLALITGILVLALRENDVFYKGKYSTSEFWSKLSKDRVVATLDDEELTNERLQVFYWMKVYDMLNYYAEQYGDYAMYYLGLDLSKPLSEQIYNKETGMTWEQYFLEEAIFTWHRYRSLVAEAEKAGYQMPADYQKEFANMKASMAESAEKSGYESIDAMLQADLGSTATFDAYYYYMESYYISNLYFDELTAKLEFTDGELDAFYEKNKESLAEYGVAKDGSLLVDFRNILVKPVATKGEDGKSVITDEAWETCLQEAQEIMQTLQSKELDGETFAALAKTKSEDKTSAANGGLYQYVGKNQLATVDIRHILVKPKGGTKDENGSVVYSDEEWETCRASAQALLDQYLAGEKTESAFGALANEHSEDQNGKVTNGGLYADVMVGQMIEAFDKWIFDSSRTPGETGLVKTPYGYHVMYFVERNGPVDAWLFAEGRKGGDLGLVKTQEGYQILFYVGHDLKWKVWCEDGLKTQTSQEMMESCAESHPIDVRYGAVVLAESSKVE